MQWNTRLPELIWLATCCIMMSAAMICSTSTSRAQYWALWLGSLTQ